MTTQEAAIKMHQEEEVGFIPEVAPVPCTHGWAGIPLAQVLPRLSLYPSMCS